ncbi:MAG TPA: hypothetical protein VD997_05645 [Phycisphaerales bacterium]|nr:hypothetical protein [Phycisphaerales bacterium]
MAGKAHTRATRAKTPQAAPSPVSPFATGGGGTVFELSVATSYVLHMLAAATPRGPEGGLIVAVGLQRRNQGHFVDDIHVHTQDQNRRERLFLQVKHGLSLTKSNLAFESGLRQCWSEFNSPSFHTGVDRIGFAIDVGSASDSVRHFREMTLWAREHDATSFFRQVQKFRSTHAHVELVTHFIRKFTKRIPAQRTVWSFLRSLVIIHFDHGITGGADEANDLDKARSLLPRGSSIAPSVLRDWIYTRCAEVAKAGGLITIPMIKERQPPGLELQLPSEAAAIASSVTLQLKSHQHGQLQREIRSKKYIPQLFAESPRQKDLCRAFTDPRWGLEVLVEALNRQVLTEVDRRLRQVGLSPVGALIDPHLQTPRTLDGVAPLASAIDFRLQQVRAILEECFAEGQTGLETKIPQKTRYRFDEIRYRLRDDAYPARNWVEEQQEWLAFSQARVVFLTANAGRGKTSFLCDLAERVLQPRGIAYFHFTGRDLRAWTGGPLEVFLLQSVFGLRAQNESARVWADLESLARDSGKPLLIMIDGLNEHSDLALLAPAIEQMLVRLNASEWVRVLLSCRAEYFDARFSNLVTYAETSTQVARLSEPVRELSAQQSKDMVWRYFRYFGIEIESVAGGVFEELRSNPLLLRTYCEAYAPVPGCRSAPHPSLTHLHKERLYREFFRRKLDAAESLVPAHAASAASRLRRAVVSIVSAMLDRRDFTSVPLDALPQEHLDGLELLLQEELVLRRDLAPASPLSGDGDVIAFTFDEMRDYCLAEHLAGPLWKQDPQRTSELLTAVLDRHSTCAEGAGRFLFLIGRRENAATLLGALSSFPGFDEVYMDCIFDLEDDAVVPEDVAKVADYFMRGAHEARRVIYGLLGRASVKRFPHLNLSSLFPTLDQLTPDQFKQTIRAAFGDDHWRYRSHERSGFEVLLDRIAADLTSRSCDELREDPGEAQLFLYMLTIPGSKSWGPASDAIAKLRRRCSLFTQSIMAQFLTQGPGYAQAASWGLVGRWAIEGGKIIPPIKELAQRPANTKGLNDDEAKSTESARKKALVELADRNHLTLDKKQVEALWAELGGRPQRWTEFGSILLRMRQ